MLGCCCGEAEGIVVVAVAAVAAAAAAACEGEALLEICRCKGVGRETYWG